MYKANKSMVERKWSWKDSVRLVKWQIWGQNRIRNGRFGYPTIFQNLNPTKHDKVIRATRSLSICRGSS